MRKKFTKTTHIIFDAFGCDKKKLIDENFILKLLLEIPELIHMKILSGPNLVLDRSKKTPGITAFEIINYSHISIHTFLKTGEIFIDIFSCRRFDHAKISKYLFSKLKVKPNQVETFEIKYPWEK
jgi:S-adenosylmethionine decarboxylase